MRSQTEAYQKSTQLTYQQVQTQHGTESHKINRRITTENQPENNYKTLDAQNSLNLASKFPSLQIKNPKATRISFALHQNIQNQISNQIEKGNIEISPDGKSFPIYSERKPTKNKAHTEVQIKSKLLEISRKKEQTILILKQIQDEALKVKRQSIQIKYKSQKQKEKKMKKQRSFFSPEQKQQVKKMLKKQRKLENELRQKTQDAFRQYQTLKLQQRQSHTKQIQQSRLLHRSFVQEKHKSIETKAQERQRQHSQYAKQYQQLKNRRYLFQEMSQKDLREAEMKQSQFRQKLSMIKTRMKTNVGDQVKQHQEKYKQIIKTQAEARKLTQKALFDEDEHQRRLSQRIKQNYFTKLIKTQIKLRKKQEELSKKKPHDYQNNIKLFTKKFETQIRPNIQISETSRFVPMVKNNSVNALNFFQQQKKGNEYLSFARKLKKCQTIQDENSTGKKTNDRNETKTKREYKNYLREMRRMSEKNPEDNQRKKFSSYLSKQDNLSQYHNFSKAFMMTQALHAKSKKSNNQRMIDTVQNKIQLLKMIL